MSDSSAVFDPEAPADELIKSLKKTAQLSKNPKFMSGSAVC